MFRALVLLIVMPWWGYGILAAAIVGISEYSHRGAVERAAANLAALEAGAPEVVDLAQYRAAEHRSAQREVNVEGWINSDYSSHLLLHDENGKTVKETYMYMLFGAEDGYDSKVVRAVMFADVDKKQEFQTALMEDFAVDMVKNGVLFQINGLEHENYDFKDLVNRAIREQGLAKAPEFFQLRPFMQGRMAYFKPRTEARDNRSFWRMLAVVALMVGALKYFARRMKFGARKAVPMSPLTPEHAPASGPVQVRRVQPTTHRARPERPQAAREGRLRPEEISSIAAPKEKKPFDVVFAARVGLAMLLVGLLFYDASLVTDRLSLLVVAGAGMYFYRHRKRDKAPRKTQLV